jgi:hypothetical protein
MRWKFSIQRIENNSRCVRRQGQRTQANDVGKGRPIMQNRTHEELAQIAKDMRQGKILIDEHVRDAGLLANVFMPLALMGKEKLEELRADPPGMIYEYMDKAGPLSVNGFPIFYSFQMLSREDAETLHKMLDKLDEAEKAALKA